MEMDKGLCFVCEHFNVSDGGYMKILKKHFVCVIKREQQIEGRQQRQQR